MGLCISNAEQSFGQPQARHAGRKPNLRLRTLAKRKCATPATLAATSANSAT